MSGPLRSRRVWALLLVGVASLCVAVHEARQYHELAHGNWYAVNGFIISPLARPAARHLLGSGATPLARASAAESFGQNPHEPLGAADRRALEAALADPDAAVRAAALAILVRHSSDLPLGRALELFEAALADEAPIASDVFQAHQQSSWALQGQLLAHERPGVVFTPALGAAALLLSVDDPPTLVFSDEVFRNEARRRAIEAAAGLPFHQREGAWDTALADARAHVVAYRTWLAGRPEPAGTHAVLRRLRDALAGHPTLDPGRYSAAIDAADRAAVGSATR